MLATGSWWVRNTKYYTHNVSSSHYDDPDQVFSWDIVHRLYTLSSNFRVKEVTSIAVKAGVRIEFVKTHRPGYLSIHIPAGWRKRKRA